MTDLARLYAPFSPTVISWRVGSVSKDKSKGMALAYIDARDVMDRLDEVCGPGGWQCRYSHTAGKTVCDIGIKIGGEWVWKADGAGDSDIEAEKGALSDAFKRAAVRWGVGRYLYNLPSPWVTLENGRYIPKAEQARLVDLLAKMKPNDPPMPRHDNDGPGSSWGPGGKQDAIDEATRDGLTKDAPKEKDSDRRRREEQAAKTKTRVDDAIRTFNMVGQSAEVLNAYWETNRKAFDWIADHFPTEYERLSQAYDDALAGASARAA